LRGRQPLHEKYEHTKKRPRRKDKRDRAQKSALVTGAVVYMLTRPEKRQHVSKNVVLGTVFLLMPFLLPVGIGGVGNLKKLRGVAGMMLLQQLRRYFNARAARQRLRRADGFARQVSACLFRETLFDRLGRADSCQFAARMQRAAQAAGSPSAALSCIRRLDATPLRVPRTPGEGHRLGAVAKSLSVILARCLFHSILLPL
jgi:hypothetical protein